MSGLERVLATHGGEWTWRGFDSGRAVVCPCGWAGCIADHRAHLAAAVAEWLAEALGSEAVREAAGAAVIEAWSLNTAARNDWNTPSEHGQGMADAALTAVTAALREAP